jgi:hypothetical protein
MTPVRTRPSRPEDLPPFWYCRHCAAMLPRDCFTPRRHRLQDGSICYGMEHTCRMHMSAKWKAWHAHRPRYAAVKPPGGGRSPTGGLAHTDGPAWAARQAKRAAFAGAIRQYAAAQWERTPAWLLARDRTPEQVEARALVVAILHYEHGWGITEAARAVERDHSTAMHLMGMHMPEPLFQELLADYRRFRAQRQAARRKAPHGPAKYPRLTATEAG